MASVAFLATACVSDEEDKFEKSAAQRMNDSVEKVTKVLESAENGWEVQFYPSHDAQAGGVPMVIFFKDGVATVYNSEAGTTSQKGLYQVKGEQECLLTFDTYMEIFHVYSEPLGSDAPYGMESDYEFCYKSISDDGNTLTFKGKRYGQPFILKKMDGSISPENYVTKIAELSEKMFSLPRASAFIGENEYEVNYSNNIFTFYETETVVEDEDEEPVEKEVAHSFVSITTLNGTHFLEPVTFQGVTFQDLIYNEEKDELATADGSIRFPFVAPKGYKSYEELAGNYTFVDADGDTYNPVVTCNGDGVTYTVKNMTYSGCDVTATYNKTFGSLEFAPQYVGQWRTYHCWLLCTTPTGGATWAPTASVIGRNDEKGNITFDGNSSYAGLIEYACSEQQITSSNILGYLTKYAEPVKWTRK